MHRRQTIIDDDGRRAGQKHSSDGSVVAGKPADPAAVMGVDETTGRNGTGVDSGSAGQRWPAI